LHISKCASIEPVFDHGANLLPNPIVSMLIIPASLSSDKVPARGQR
jgi:hypothetical protein